MPEFPHGPHQLSRHMPLDARIYVAGHRGLVGSAICRALSHLGYSNVITRPHADLDLRNQASVLDFFFNLKPKYVILAAARVGGILANSEYPADFIRDNLEIQTNVIEASYRTGVDRLLFLGSSCIYPKLSPQPIHESYLLTGPLEPSNRPYAIAKIAGIEMCWSYNRQFGTRYLAAMPTNLYGLGDNYDLIQSHVLPALIRKTIQAKISGAKEVVVWGTGNPRREFLVSDDVAQACIHLLNLKEEVYSSLLNGDEPPLVNIGTGEDISIAELAETILRVLEFGGSLTFDTSKPDGTPSKLLDVSRIHKLGWHHEISLEEGIRKTYLEIREQLQAG